jgi:glycosyltransferase involved in cell wall biosynthesis
VTSDRITYVIGTYPQLTTTFIDREISALIARGVDVRIVAMRRPPQPPSDAQRALAERTEYVLPPSPLRLLASQLGWLLRRPGTYLHAIAFLLSRRHEHGSRLRTVAHFLMGADVARRVRSRTGSQLHAHFADRAAIVAYVAGRLLGTGYSLTAHANDIYLRPTMLPMKIGASRVTITCTQYNVEYLQGRLPGAVAAKVRRIYHGLELDRYVALERAATDQPVIVSVGQLKEKKGLRYLVDAMALLRDRGIRARCRIIGEGPLREELEAQVKSVGLDGSVELLGALPHDAVLHHYAEAAVFTLPCVVASDGDRDGIPNAILEAMAAGIPVVSTPTSGIPEVVRDDDTGLLVPVADRTALADALERLVRDPELRERLGGSGRAFVVDAFDVRRNAERFLEAIDARA